MKDLKTLQTIFLSTLYSNIGKYTSVLQNILIRISIVHMHTVYLNLYHMTNIYKNVVHLFIHNSM